MDETRRTLLATMAGSVTLAGCLGSRSSSGGDGTAESNGGGGSEDGGSDSSDAATLETHPAARNLAAQPAEGPPPGEAAGTIVAFEDPSCSLCASFESETVPRIRSELVDPGDATFVFRGYPIRYEWGKPATRALEATYAADATAHWTLAEHYFSNQGEFSSAGRDQVLSKTREFLAANTAVDADAVVAAVENGDAEPAVQTDLDAGNDAGASATPAVFLFRDGEYQTMYSSSIGFDAIEAALQL